MHNKLPELPCPLQPLDVLFPMALVSDEGLTEEELREKRKQVFLRNTTEGRR
jgi:hypothetical protein